MENTKFIKKNILKNQNLYNQVFDRELELDILATIIFNEHLSYKITSLNEDDFYSLDTKQAFNKFKECFDKEGIIDVSALSGESIIYKELAGRVYTVQPYALDYKIKKLKELSAKRKLQRIAYDTIIKVEEGREYEEIKNYNLEEIGKIEVAKKDLTVPEIDSEFEKVLEERKPVSIESGYSKLDWLAGGFLNGSLDIIAAAQGLGKTSFVVNILCNICKKGKKVLFVTLEMSLLSIYSKIISYLSGVPFIEILRGSKRENGLWIDFDKEEWIKINNARAEVSKYNLCLYGQKGLNTSDIKAKLKDIGGADIVFVDYLQRLKPVSAYNSMYERVSNIAQELKTAAVEADIPFVVISSINRDYSDRRDFKPQISDLRGSGDIEFDSDMVLLLHRESAFRDAREDENEAEFEHRAELIIAKNRYGASNLGVNFYFDGDKGLFKEIEDKYKGDEKWK